MNEITATRSGLCIDGVQIANFTIAQTKPLYDLGDPSQLAAVELQLTAPECSRRLIADVHASLTAQILAAVPTCRLLNSGCSGAIDAYIINQAVAAHERGLFCRDFGLHRLFNDHWVFVAGDEILGDCGGYSAVVHPQIAAAHLAWDEAEDERAAIVRILHEIERNPTTIWPAFSYTLLSSLRSQVIPLGLTTFPVLYVVGQQGYGKTLLITRYGLLYDAKGAMPNPWGKLEANSTAKGIMKGIENFRDQVVLIDDLAKGSDLSVQTQRQKLMAEVLRFAANDNIRRTASMAPGQGSQICRAGVAFTGEIPMTAASDLTRMIEVKLSKAMTGGKDSDRACAARTFRAWMLWLLPHLDDELSNLKRNLADISGGENARLETTKALLLWIVELFYRFSMEMDIIGKDYYDSAITEAAQIFDHLLAAQAEKVQTIQSRPPEGNLCWYILQGYRRGCFHVVARKQIKNDRDCVVEHDALCIRTITLLHYLQSQANFQSLTEKEMTKTLQKEGVFTLHTEKRSATKRINGKRYLELSFEALQASARHY